MSITNDWNEGDPDGSIVDADQIDDKIKALKTQVREIHADLGNTNLSGLLAGQSAVWAFLTTKKAYSPYHDNGNSGASFTIDWNNSNLQKLTLTANCTLTLSNPQTGAVYIVQLKQDGTGSRTVTWPAAVKWAGGTALTLTTTASRSDLISLLWNGVDYFATPIGLNYNA